MAATKAKSTISLSSLDDRISNVEERMAKQPFVVPMGTLAPTKFRLQKPIPIVLQPQDEGFIASFLDANINASGDTEAEALDNLKDILVATLRKLLSLPPNKLGPGPARQLAILTEFVAEP